MTDPAASVTRLAFIAEARERGITWAAIGATMFDGASGKAAKAAAKRLARDTNRELVAAEAQKPTPQPGPQYEHVLGETHEPMYTVTGPGVVKTCRSRECDC